MDNKTRKLKEDSHEWYMVADQYIRIQKQKEETCWISTHKQFWSEQKKTGKAGREVDLPKLDVASRVRWWKSVDND